jgi:hypothetical protein
MRILFVAVLVGLVAAAPAGATSLSHGDGTAINRTLDAFVASAVKRENVDGRGSHFRVRFWR